MAEPASAAELARRLADALERHALPYAMGGAIALAYYAPPRATVDVDVNVFVAPATGLPTVLAALTDAAFIPDTAPPALRQQALADGQFRGRVGGMRVDVFVPAIPYYAELQTRRRQVELLGRPLSILGPEDLVVLKMMFFRRKDLADVESLLRTSGAHLDRAFVRAKLAELAGADDARLRALAEIERDVLGPA